MSTAITEGIVGGVTAVFEPLTVQQYHAMISSGILREGSPVELIDGMLVRKDRRDREGSIMTVGPGHSFTVTNLDELFDELLKSTGFHVRTQQPLTLSGTSEPEPDGSIVRGTAADYRKRHPGPSDTTVVIEVADSSLEYDRVVKLKKYAAAGIPVYWIINLRDNEVEVYLRPLPADERYEDCVRFRSGDSLEVALDSRGITLEVESLFGDDST